MDADTLLAKTISRLHAHEGRYAEIARQNPRLTYSWLTKLAHGQIQNPTVSSLQALIEALDAFEGVGLAEPDKPAAQPAQPPAAAPADDQDPDEGRVVPLEDAA